jgi:hypothetical protein
VLGVLCTGIIFFIHHLYIYYNLYLLLYVSIVLVTISIVTLVIFYLTLPSDHEFDDWLANQENVVASSVLTKLDLDVAQIDPLIPRRLVVSGFVVPWSELAAKRYNKKVYYQIGRDRRIRFSVNTLLYFVPVKDHIAVFSTDINAVEQSLRYQETSHYYYHDVVGLTAHDQQIPIDYHRSRIMLLFQDFSLRVSNGDSVGTSVLVGIRSIKKSELKNMPTFITVDSEVDRIISGLLYLLREKNKGNL